MEPGRSPRVGNPMSAARIRRLTLSNFRSYRAASADARRAACRAGRAERRRQDQPDRGDLVSRARDAACAARRSTRSRSPKATARGRWRRSSKARWVSRRSAPASSRPPSEDATSARKCRIDGEPVASAAAFADHLSVVWLTPAMDGLFGGPASERRRFLDRLVLAVDGTHIEPRQRAGAIACARATGCSSSRAPTRTGSTRSSTRPPRSRSRSRPRAPRRCGGSPPRSMRDRDPASPFPWAGVALDGWVENALLEQPATEVEDRYRAVLRENRARDAAAGRTTDGPHLTDLEVLYGPKGIAASAGLDRRAEGAADRTGAGACRTGRRDDAARAAAAARRSRRASRSRPPRRALRCARGARRAGVDDRCRSGAVRRGRGARADAGGEPRSGRACAGRRHRWLSLRARKFKRLRIHPDTARGAHTDTSAPSPRLQPCGGL